MKSGTLAERAASALWDDVTDRRGWQQEADGFDVETRNSILDAWVAIIEKAARP